MSVSLVKPAPIANEILALLDSNPWDTEPTRDDCKVDRNAPDVDMCAYIDTCHACIAVLAESAGCSHCRGDIGSVAPACAGSGLCQQCWAWLGFITRTSS